MRATTFGYQGAGRRRLVHRGPNVKVISALILGLQSGSDSLRRPWGIPADTNDELYGISDKGVRAGMAYVYMKRGRKFRV